MPKRSRSGLVSMPARVVAPTSVKGGRSSFTERAAGPLADHDVDLVVLERGIEDLLDHRREAVDLVDEEDVVGLEVGEDGGEVAGALQHRPRGLLQVHAHLARDDVRERGLAEARRAEEEHVVERLLAVPRRGDEDLELLADLRLPDVLGELARAQRPFLALLHRRGGVPGDEAVGFDHQGASDLFTGPATDRFRGRRVATDAASASLDALRRLSTFAAAARLAAIRICRNADPVHRSEAPWLSITSWRGASRPGGSHRRGRAPPAAALPLPAPRGHYSQGRAAH